MRRRGLEARGLPLVAGASSCGGNLGFYLWYRGDRAGRGGRPSRRAAPRSKREVEAREADAAKLAGQREPLAEVSAAIEEFYGTADRAARGKPSRPWWRRSTRSLKSRGLAARRSPTRRSPVPNLPLSQMRDHVRVHARLRAFKQLLRGRDGTAMDRRAGDRALPGPGQPGQRAGPDRARDLFRRRRAGGGASGRGRQARRPVKRRPPRDRAGQTRSSARAALAILLGPRRGLSRSRPGRADAARSRPAAAAPRPGALPRKTTVPRAACARVRRRRRRCLPTKSPPHHEGPRAAAGPARPRPGRNIFDLAGRRPAARPRRRRRRRLLLPRRASARFVGPLPPPPPDADAGPAGDLLQVHRNVRAARTGRSPCSRRATSS